MEISAEFEQSGIPSYSSRVGLLVVAKGIVDILLQVSIQVSLCILSRALQSP